MKRKMYWGISILIILFIGASVFMLMRNTDTGPEKVYIGLSEEHIDEIRSQFKRPSKIAQDVVTKQVSEGSDHEGTSESSVNVSQNETVSIEEASESDYVWTREKMVHLRDSELKNLPEHIEILGSLVENLEKSYKRNSIAYENSQDNKLLKQLRDQAKKQLDFKRGMLSRTKYEFEKLSKPDGLEYLISSMGLEGKLATEADNEK